MQCQITALKVYNIHALLNTAVNFNYGVSVAVTHNKMLNSFPTIPRCTCSVRQSPDMEHVLFYLPLTMTEITDRLASRIIICLCTNNCTFYYFELVCHVIDWKFISVVQYTERKWKLNLIKCQGQKLAMDNLFHKQTKARPLK